MSSEEPSALFFCCGFRSTVVELRPNGSPITVLSRCVNTDFHLRKIRIYRLISKIDVVNIKAFRIFKAVSTKTDSFVNVFLILFL